MADYLDEMIELRKKEDPGFAAEWAPSEVMLKLIELRAAQGITQQQVADTLGVNRTRITELERNPDRVSFRRIMDYAAAVGAMLTVTPIGEAPAAPAVAPAKKRGRPVGSAQMPEVAKNRGAIVV